MDMIEEIFYQDTGKVNITAASVGISKRRWVSVAEDDIESKEYEKIMERNRFDHLPIIPNKGSITEYFKTRTPNNFEKIDRLQIKYDDVIPLDMGIGDIIKMFAGSNGTRTCFFLGYNREITGLITQGNLNCKQVQVYIFNIVCEVERELGDFVNCELLSEEILEWVRSKIDPNRTRDKYQAILDEYERLRKADMENLLTEHFYLIDYFKIIQEKCLYKKLDFSKSEWKAMSSINELRKRIAHPSRSLIDPDNKVEKLQERLNKLEDLAFRLSIYKQGRLDED